jgi:hypothetical protein
MWQRSISIFANIILLLLIGCTEMEKKDTFLNFTVEGNQYQVGGVGFYYSQAPHTNRYYIMIDQQTQKTPRGQIQWTMELNGLEELIGKQINFSKLESEAKTNKFAEPLAMFTLGKDIMVHPPLTLEDNTLIINITSIDSKYAEGSFSGSDLDFLSTSGKIYKKVNITGRFRAKLYRGQ